MDTQSTSIIFGVIIAHFFALLSPGPDFILIVKSGMQPKLKKHSGKTALGLPLGIACANGVYIAVCIAGLGRLLVHSYLLLRIIQAFGGIFLLYLAVKALAAPKQSYEQQQDAEDSAAGEPDRLSEFAIGFISGISNPKNLVFYLSLFAMVLSEDIGIFVKLGLGFWMALAVFLWDSFILLLLKRRHLQSFFSRGAFSIDKIAGILLGSLGITLILTAIKESTL